MSGPVAAADASPADGDAGRAAGPTVEVLASRATEVGGMEVRRALPKRGRRTVGAWCFVDHFGPGRSGGEGMQVGPHPHIGLHTVTWLLDGSVVHADSLGTEQPIRPGQLNLMTAGRGVAHAEASARGSPPLHGVQLWVAQPEATRHGDAAFEHHAELPAAELGGLTATVLVGELAGARSPATADTPLLGADLAARGDGVLPLDPGFEHALVVLDGALGVDGQVVEPGALAYLGVGRDELPVRAVRPDGPARALLLGGRPFGEDVLMWWNFVARTRDELAAAWADWHGAGDRFTAVRSDLPPIPAPRPWWA